MHGSSEPYVGTDRHVPRSREVGGVNDGRSHDAPATTGMDQNEEFVGRVAKGARRFLDAPRPPARRLEV